MKPAIAALLLGLAACGRGPAGEAPPTQRLEGLTVSQSLGGTPRWDLRAEAALLSEDDKQAFLTEPRMELFKAGKPATRLTARAGTVRTDNHDVRLSTGVVVRSLEDGAVLRTEELLYSSGRDRLHTELPVEIVRDGHTVRGRGMEAKPDLSELRIFSQRTVIKEGG